MDIKCPNCKKFNLDIKKIEMREEKLFVHFHCYVCEVEFSGFLTKNLKESPYYEKYVK